MDLNEKIERLKVKANIFLKENKKAFVRDIYNNYYFCYIKECKSDKLSIENFDGPRFNEGKIKETIYWIDITDIKEYKEAEK
jgi:hypothetical protein